MVKEWEATTIGALGDWYGGLTPSMSNPAYWNGNVPWLSSGEIKEPLITKSSKCITELALKQTSLSLLPKGTLVIVVRSGILRVYFPVAQLQTEMVINQDLKGIIVHDNLSSNFVLHLLTYLGREILKSCLKSGTTVESIELKWLKGYDITLPPLPEQRAIAAALSDTDAYIATLEKLIAKKRAVKQGVMQELLTGKRRLPGFMGAWTEKSLGEVGWLSKESINPQLSPATMFAEYSMPAFDDSRHPQKVSGRSMRSTRLRISSNALLFNKLNIRQRRIWLVVFCCENAVCSSEFLPYYSEEISLEFMLQLLMTDKVTSDFEGMSTGTSNSQKRIIPSNFLEYKVLMPPTNEEQTAIAEVLSDMDAEIDALTAKLNKVKHIKQGMMSELLTGRIRLVESVPVNATVEAYSEQEAEPVRQVSEQPSKGHNQQFDDAVMIAGIVNALYSDKFPLGRKKVQKCLYLLRRHQDESTKAFKKKAAGPYADEVRYKGGEPIARGANYIATTTAKQGTTFARGKNISQALGYITAWGKQSDIKWVADKLKFKKVDELELLATVDMAICDLAEAGTPVTIESIKNLIASNAEWKAKLKKQTFSDANIARATKELEILL